MLPPEEIVIRPPIEAYSVLIPVTGGCSWNQCRFCGVYKGIQDFAIRPLEDVLCDIDLYARMYPKAPWIYLAGGNPTCTPTEYLEKIIRHVKASFHFVERISCYAKALDIIRKDDNDLKKLAEAGLNIVYMGLESGADQILSFMKKGTTAQTIITASRRLLAAGIQVSLYVILGLGGRKWTEIHARETARVLNAINSTFFRFRTLNIMDNSPLKEDIEKGTYEILTPLEILKEMRSIIADLSSDLTSAMRNDHISNYLNLESDNIGTDRVEILRILDQYIADSNTTQWKHKNLKHM